LFAQRSVLNITKIQDVCHWCEFYAIRTFILKTQNGDVFQMS